MSSMADQAAAAMRRDGIDTTATVDDAMNNAGSSAEGAGGNQVTPPDPTAGSSNTDGGTPDTIPYSRFQEVNSRYQQLREYERLQQAGISPDSAARLAAFEQGYMANPTGTIESMIDQQDLPDERKAALKALLREQSGSSRDSALEGENGEDQVVAALSPEDRELLDWARERRVREHNDDNQQRIDLMLTRWRQRDEAEGVTGTTERQRLQYISTAAGSPTTFQTLEEMSDAARTMYLEDRDANLGGVVRNRGDGGGPLAVPSGGLPGTAPVVPKNMAEARKLVLADIAAGRLPDLKPQG